METSKSGPKSSQVSTSQVGGGRGRVIFFNHWGFRQKLTQQIQTLLISTLTWAIQFLNCFPHRRDMYQSRPGTPRAAPRLGKIPQIFAEIPKNPEVANLQAPILLFEGTYPPMTHMCLKSPCVQLLEYTPLTPPYRSSEKSSGPSTGKAT